jgi:hypothetical protein
LPVGVVSVIGSGGCLLFVVVAASQHRSPLAAGVVITDLTLTGVRGAGGG